MLGCDRRSGGVTRWFIAGALLSFAGDGYAATLTHAQWNDKGSTARLELLLTDAVAYRIETLTDPNRLVIELPRTRATASLPALAKRMGNRGTLGSLMRGGQDLRLVYTTTSSFAPRASLHRVRGGQRLIVEWDWSAPKAAAVVAAKSATPVAPAKTVARNQSVAAKSARAGKLRPVTIAIDAGHGGEDPGAHGPAGTREKDVTLRIARLLADRVRADRGMKAYLVRDGDYFVPLGARMRKARAKQADFFVSVHADAADNRGATGASVYTLSQRGATSVAARWLANKENAADLLGGVTLDDKDNALASVLLELTQNASSDASYDAGSVVLQQLQRLGAVHHDQVQYAAFAVLKSPDVPSILVETAFISNPSEERKLRSDRYQQQLAEAIYSGIRRYFERNPLPGTLFADVRQHTIEPGDTLGKLAEQYQVTPEAIREQNNLTRSRLQPGQVLTIPPLTERTATVDPLS